MRDHRTRSTVPRLLLAALVPLFAAPRPAEAQVRDFIAERVEGFGRFVTGPPRPRAPAGVEPCENLYGPEARRIALDRDLVERYADWILGSYETIRHIGPLPICFPFERHRITTRLSQRLLEVNNYYLTRHRESYLLTGYTDQAENDLNLGRRRAEEIQNQSPLPSCRYRVARRRGENVVQYRKVLYTRDAIGAAHQCPR